MQKYIIFSSCLFGSIYFFSKSLELINKPLLKNKKILNELIIINGLTFVMSGYIVTNSLRNILYILNA
jgi:hypothetical protein